MGHFTDLEFHVLVNFADLKEGEQICPISNEPWNTKEPPKDMAGVSGLLGKFKIENNTLRFGAHVYHWVVNKWGRGQWSPDANFIVDLPPREKIVEIFSKAREHYEGMAKIDNLYDYSVGEIIELLNCGEEYDDFYLPHFYDVIVYGDPAGTKYHVILGELEVVPHPHPEGADRGGYNPTVVIGEHRYYVDADSETFCHHSNINDTWEPPSIEEVNREELMNKLVEEVNNKNKLFVG